MWVKVSPSPFSCNNRLIEREGLIFMATKRVDKDFEVSIVNNVRGGFFYSSPNGEFIIDMQDFGDEDYVTFGDLKSLMSRNRKVLTELRVVINGTIDDGFTLEDVIHSLKLQDSYEELLALGDEKLADVEHIDIELIEDFVQESDAEKIARVLGSKKSKLKRAIAEAAADLYKRDELSDYNKMKAVAEQLGHDDIQSFWADIDSSNR